MAPPRPVGAVLRLLCLLAYNPRLVSATYSCSAIGIECLNRIYVGSYATEAAAKAACDANINCVAYDYAAAQSLGFQCSTTTTRVDITSAARIDSPRVTAAGRGAR